MRDFKPINEDNMSYEEVVKAWEEVYEEKRELQTEIFYLKSENAKLKDMFKHIGESNISIRNQLRRI